jgi:hypothetical protein
MGARIMNKKQAKAARKGYKEAGQLYWTDEMAAILKGLHRKNKALLGAVSIESIFILGFILRANGVI